MADGTYDDFEAQLTHRLLTIDEEIAAAKEQGRRALKTAGDKVGRVLAAQQIKIKLAEKSRVGAMLAGVQQQKSELALSNFTKQYVNLMQKSSKIGPSISEKQVVSVVRAYEDKIEGSHSVGSMLLDSTEDTMESTVEAGADVFASERSGDDAYAELFGVDEPEAAAEAPAAAAAAEPPDPPSGPSDGGVVDPLALLLPSVPSSVVGGAPPPPAATPKAHRRTPSLTGAAADQLGFML